MGQRLNIEIVKDGDVLANAYYHWSAYSNSAIELTEHIIKRYKYVENFGLDSKCKNNDLLLAIRLLETTGAGMDEVEMEYAKEKVDNNEIDFQPLKDRNEGIISVTEKGIQETESWEEGRVTIYLDSKTFDFDVIFGEDLDTIVNEYGVNKEDIQEVAIRFLSVPFEEVFDIKSIIDKANYNNKFYFHNVSNDSYFSLIQ